MKKRVLALITVFILLFNISGVFADSSDSIIILYENDTHCATEGFAKLASLKSDFKNDSNYVGVVSSGDFIQGGSIGAISKGQYIIDLMNDIGYDAVVPGNHEFDFKIDRLFELEKSFNSPIVCANLIDIKTNKNLFKPYVIVPYGKTKIAYIGVTTPDTVNSSSPSQFSDEKGNPKYSFSGENLYEVIQKNIDSAKKDGADFIVVLSHLGTEYVKEEWMAQALIKNTTGIDVCLDGHSHSTVPKMIVKDKSGKDVIISSTGTKFQNVGKLTIEDNKINTELIPLKDYDKKDEKVTKHAEKIYEEYKKIGDKKIGETKVFLTTEDKNGKRIIRNNETNLGDFCADAFRIMTDSDIAYMNGGGIRSNINKGDITFNNLLQVFPFSNTICIAEVTGQTILESLEFAVYDYPKEHGGFQQVSGIKFDLDESVKSPVILDENMKYQGLKGENRVKNVMVLNKENKYEPLDLNKTYKLCSHNFLLKEGGDGATIFKSEKHILDTGITDLDILENYINEKLDGVIGEEYLNSQGRINIISSYIPLRKTFEAMNYKVIWTPLAPKKVIVNTNDGDLIFNADTNKITVYDKEYDIDRTTYIENGVTYISKDCLDLIK